MTRRSSIALVLALVSALAPLAHAAPYTLTAADRDEITALARAFFEATRDGARDPQNVYPTAADLRALMPAPRGARDGGVTIVDEIAMRQFRSIERDASALRSRFAGATFVGLGTSYRNGRIDLRPCGRFARATSQCGDGPVIEYAVGAETRRFRIDTLVRLRGHWRVFDVRQ